MVKFIQNNEEIEFIRFPITDVGKQSNVTIIVENTSIVDPIELIPKIDDDDLQIVEYPRTLQAQESATVIFSFSPKETRETSLKTKFLFEEIIG